MAYVNKYYATWGSLKGLSGYLYIDQNNYVGAASSLKLRHNGIELSCPGSDWNSRVLGLMLTFDIVNDKTDFYELLPLLYATEREYKIRLVVTAPSTYTLFEGFLNCDVITQKMLHKQTIQFAASSYLSKLEYIIPDELTTYTNMTFIDIIDSILRQTGGEYNIMVNSSLYAQGDTLEAGATLFSKNSFFTEVFWENNVDKKDALSILNSILKSFNCYLYWYDQHWYIERYKDIWNNSINYVEYTTGGIYDSSASDTGSVVPVSYTELDIHAQVPQEQSQEISIIPGYNKIEIKLMDNKFLNLIINDFTDVSYWNNGIGDPGPTPEWRKWQVAEAILGLAEWSNAGQASSNISNSIQRVLWDSLDLLFGIYTRFTITISDSTTLTFSFKFRTSLGAIGGAEWADYTFVFNWYLHFYGTEDAIIYNESAGVWEVSPGTNFTIPQEIEVSGSQFDPDTGIVEVSKSIDLSQLGSAYEGDVDLRLGLGREVVKRTGVADTSCTICWWGDVTVVTNENPQNNVITGLSNQLFLNKKTEEIDLYDCPNQNYKNAILRSYNPQVRTSNWTDDGITFMPLTDHLLRDLFQLYNVSKQKITVDIQYAGRLKPLQMFYDSKQSDKPFILIGYNYRLVFDTYGIVLLEYDNETEINLI